MLRSAPGSPILITQIKSSLGWPLSLGRPFNLPSCIKWVSWARPLYCIVRSSLLGEHFPLRMILLIRHQVVAKWTLLLSSLLCRFFSHKLKIQFGKFLLSSLTSTAFFFPTLRWAHAGAQYMPQERHHRNKVEREHHEARPILMKGAIGRLILSSSLIYSSSSPIMAIWIFILIEFTQEIKVHALG